MQNEILSPILGQSSDLEFLTRLNTTLATHHNDEQSINKALELIGKHTRCDRVEVVEVQHNMTVGILHEWHRQGLQAIQTSIPHQMLADKELAEQLYSQNFILLDAEDSTISNDVKSQIDLYESKQVVLYPLQEAGEQFAFIAFIQCSPTPEREQTNIRLLGSIASIVATNLHNKHMIEKLKRHLLASKKQEEKMLFLKSELSTLNEKLQPAWQQLKRSLESTDKGEQLELFGQCLHSLDKLCQPTPLKQQQCQ